MYLQFARVYHPDVTRTGDKDKFQRLTAAYERLQADQAGYNLTEEDLYDLYKNSQREAEERERRRHEQYEAEYNDE